MKLFVSWSGELSHRIALHLKEWLPVVLPFVEVWVSSEDIPKGRRWGAELATPLEGTDAGIVCLVPGNIDEPWLNFEAGVLSKSVQKARVYPFLLALDPSKLTGPLGQFQATRFSKDDVKRLVNTINSKAPEGTLRAARLDRSLEVCWPDLERRLASVLAEAEAPTDGAELLKERATSSLTDEDVKVLGVIANANDGMRREEVAAIVGVHPQRAQHIMERLEVRGLLVAAHNYVYGTSWHLSKDARTSLVRQGIL